MSLVVVDDEEFNSRSIMGMKKLDIKPSFIMMRYLTCSCGVTYFTEENLNAHFLETGHDEIVKDLKTYQCNYCTKTFDLEKNLLKHHLMGHQLSARDKKILLMSDKSEFIATPDGKFECNICNKVLKTKLSLTNHKQIHTGEKPYKCELCDKAFRGKLNLEVHLNTHTGSRPYACKKCPMAFGSYSNLRRHEFRHLGLKPHQCENCDRSFVSKTELKWHHNTVHLKIPYPYKRKPRGTGRPRMTVTNAHKFGF